MNDVVNDLMNGMVTDFVDDVARQVVGSTNAGPAPVIGSWTPLLGQSSPGDGAISQLILLGITIVAILVAAIFTVVLTKRQD